MRDEYMPKIGAQNESTEQQQKSRAPQMNKHIRYMGKFWMVNRDDSMQVIYIFIRVAVFTYIVISLAHP